MMACASGSIFKSLSAAQLDKLKNQVVDLLQSSEGRLDLCLFKKGYKDFYKKKFDQQFGSLRSKKLKDVMAELDDVVSLEKIGSSVIIVLKVTEESCDTSVSKDVDSAQKYKANSTLPDLKSQEVDLDSKVPLSSSVKPDRGETHPSVPGLDVKSPDPGKPKNVPAGESYSQPAKQKAAKGLQMTPPQVPTGGKNKHAGPCFSEIMQQQEQEERLADDGDHSVPTGYERLLSEVQATPSPVKRTAVHSTPELKDARVRKIGPGPFEKSFDHAQQLLSTVKPKPTLKHLSLVEVNTAAENIITSLSEDGKFVSLELVKAKLCKQFGKESVSALGFRRDKDIPALNDLIQLQNKVSLFVHAYVMSNSIATLYELGQSLVDLISRQDSSKQDFEDLRLGPLLQQPVVYDMFKAPSSLPSPPHITTIQILKHLEKYMTEENLWREKVDLKKFMEYLCEERGCDTPYELGVRIQSVGLAISVIKQAKRSDSERWKAAREEVSAGMDEDIQRQLRKIRKDLLGQELGDLRSSVMRILDASPVDALNELFNCCLQLFEGKHQKKITDFFTCITRHALGRHLFQLALNTSCKGLVGDAVEQMVADEVEKRVADNARQSQEKDTRPVAPSEGVVLKEVSAWLANADNIDLSTLATIESTVMNKFPEFNSFEELGYGSFLKFLTSHKELLEAIKQVGGLAMAGSGGLGTKVGHQVLANSVLDFISQCGTQASPEMVERNLCTYYSINKVTDLGFGALSNLLTKASGRQKNMTGMNAHSIVYEAALMCHLPGTNEDSENRTTGSALGYMSKEDAIAAIRSTPLLEDVALWTHWDEVFGGEVSALGDLKSFLEKERILINAGKSTPGKHGSLVVVETSPGVLLRVTTNTSPEIFKECACRGDSVGAAGHLVSMVMVNGGVANTPVALLANHIQSSLASMVVLGGNDGRCDFVLECLVRMPRKLAQAVGTKVFLEPLKKLVGSTDAPSLLLSSCSTHHQRSRLHRLGFVLGVSQWIEDFQSRVSAQNEEELKPEEEQGEHQTRPLAVIRPIQFTNKQTRQTEESVTTIEDEMSTPLSETSVKEDEQEVSSDADNDSQVQLTSLTTDQEICRAVIEQIRREEFGIGLELGEEESKLVQRQREREGRGLHRLSTELYSRDTHFVLELVQNADDNSYPEEGCSVGFPSLIFVLQQDRIVVLNNEVGFMEKNIRALCDVGKSTKGAHRYGYIGQKGIGFKSVFRVSDCPEVHSNGFHIRFDAKSGPIGYILPQWIEERSEEEPICEEGVEKLTEDNSEREVHPVSSEYDGWSTRIVLPLKEELQGMEERSLAARFRDVHPSLLLFLHRLRAISIRDQVNNTRHEMIRTDLGDKIMEISHTKGTDRWLVVKKELDASNIKRDVEMTELALAFPLFRDTDQDTSLGRKHQSLPQQYVFAYLPLRSYGFRFIIQGDFEVPSSREDVDSDKSWNQWLREEIPQLFVDAMSVFMDHPSFSAGLSSVASYFQFVPLEEEILDFFTPVARRILTLLQGKTCIPVKETKQEANSFNWVLPCKAVLCQDSTTLELITPALLEKHLGLRYLHSDIAAALNPTLRSRLGIETLSSKHLLEIGKAEAKKFTADEDPRPEVVKITWLARWFQCMYRCLEQERNSSQDILDLISSLSVIPLTDGTFVNLKGDSVFLPLSLKKSSAATAPKKVTGSSTEQTCFSVLERDLSTVHPVLFSSLDDIGRSQVEQLLRLLGVKSWSARDLINSHIVPTLNSDKWKAKSNEVLRSYLVYILEQRLSDPSVCDVDQLRSCVQILTNKGPLNPTETPIHFTPRFGNTVDLARHLPSISWTLVDDSYLDASTKARSTDWKAFLADLGVQSFLSIKKKQVKLHRSNMSQSPWASCEPIWQTTPDGMYVIEDWSCEEFEEFIGNVTTSGDESTVLAQCIDERWNNEYSQYADGLVHVKDSSGHTLNETKSSFYLNLVSKPWMSARGEASNLFIPRDLFIRGENVNRLLEDHVKYTAADLKNSAFISVLHIRESISADGMISEMKKWSSVQSRDAVEGGQSKVFITSLAHMREVYSFLFERMSHNEDERKKINEAFHKNALIFVPHHYQDSSSKQVHMGNRMPGSFYLKKDVCWRDPTDVASKLLKDHGKVTTRHLLHGYYHRTSAQQSFAAFFVDELNVDETPTMNEYLELAATIADIGRFPTPPSLKNMLKIFSALGKKCIARCHNDCVGEENEIDLKMAAFLKQSLEREEKNIFPCRGKWVSLSDKPLLADEKSLLKIFQKLKEKDPLVGEDGKEKKKCVFFLDFGDFFESSKQLDRKQEREREETKQNVSIFLKICEVKALTECVQKEFIPTLVQYHCAPLQKYFHQLMPHVQRFLHSKNSQVYKDLKRKRFAEKLGQMQFASVESLETVYSLSTHPDVLVPIKEKSGLQSVGSSFCLYVVHDCLEKSNVLNTEIVKLLLGEKNQSSPELHNFLVAVKIYDGSDFDSFLEDIQGLKPLPDDEELWYVPPPEEPDVVEVEEEAPVEFPSTLHPNTPGSYRSGDDGLHSWPPKSAAQYDKTRKCEGDPGDSVLNVWPPPAPPESMKPTREEQIQGKATPRDARFLERPKEHEGNVREDEASIRQHHPPSQSVAIQEPAAERISPNSQHVRPTDEDLAHHEQANVQQAAAIQGQTPEETAHQPGFQSAANSAIAEGVTEAGLPNDPHANENFVPATVQINPQPLQISLPPGEIRLINDLGLQARSINSSHAYLWFDSGIQNLDFEDFSFPSDTKVFDRIPLLDATSREDVGRWGEQCVYEFLLNQTKFLPQDVKVDIVWVNKKGNTTRPYDLEIRRHIVGVEGEVITYVEVKTTTSDQKDIFEISVQEIQFALTNQQAFHLYRVFNAGNPSCLRIRRLQNLAAHLEGKNVKLCLMI